MRVSKSTRRRSSPLTHQKSTQDSAFFSECRTQRRHAEAAEAAYRSLENAGLRVVCKTHGVSQTTRGALGETRSPGPPPTARRPKAQRSCTFCRETDTRPENRCTAVRHSLCLPFPKQQESLSLSLRPPKKIHTPPSSSQRGKRSRSAAAPSFASAQNSLETSRATAPPPETPSPEKQAAAAFLFGEPKARAASKAPLRAVAEAAAALGVR